MIPVETDLHRAMSLKCLAPDAVDSYLKQCGDRVACVIGFGENPVSELSGHPVLWVNAPVLDGDAVYEVWTSDKPLKAYRDDLMKGACNDDIFFGCMSIEFDTAEDLSATALRAYSGLFEFLQRDSHPNLLRVWNYFPQINVIENGIERYRSFSVGRHEAFVRYNRRVHDSPAACALGNFSGPLVIYFIAAREPGVQIENPRQTSAYNYPTKFGPRSPTFSRATLAFQGAAQTLFISGTASIVGHDTVHHGSVELQTRETLANIRAVIDQARLEGFKFAGFEQGMALKVYVRNPEDLATVLDLIHAEWGALKEMVVIQADICRTDLLLEIEAACWSSVS